MTVFCVDYNFLTIGHSKVERLCFSLNYSEGLDIVSYALPENPLSQNISLSESVLYVYYLSWHEFSNCICKCSFARDWKDTHTRRLFIIHPLRFSTSSGTWTAKNKILTNTRGYHHDGPVVGLNPLAY